MYSKIFWGIVVVVFGLSIIMNAVFKINFPFFKVLFAVIIIGFGFKILVGAFGGRQQHQHENSTVFNSSSIQVENLESEVEYNSVFGSQTVDLRKAQFKGREANVEVNAVFGSIKIILPERAQVRIKASSAFGAVRLPDGESVSFGEAKRSYVMGIDPEQTLYIEANAVFGGVDIR